MSKYIVRNLLMIKKTKVDDFLNLRSVHVKKVYMVSDESMLPITFYNRWKMTLMESLIG